MNSVLLQEEALQLWFSCDSLGNFIIPNICKLQLTSKVAL